MSFLFAGFLCFFAVMVIVFGRAERARQARNAARHEQEQRFLQHVRGIIQDHGGTVVDGGRPQHTRR
jgi:hypothetical protein